jgi:hypothetical protein
LGRPKRSSPRRIRVECWFKSNTSTGGALIDFGDTTLGTSTNKDRVIYLDSGGKLTFGTYVSGYKTIRSALTYNDNTWHHVAASLGAAGLKLYVDGTRVASDATTTTGLSQTGYWRWAGDDLTGWPNAPTSSFYTGLLDEIAIYNTQLTAQQIAWHYHANH